MREYVFTEIDETPQHAKHAIITMDGLEIYRISFEQENWPKIVEAAVVASKSTAAWFDEQAAFAVPASAPGEEKTS